MKPKKKSSAVPAWMMMCASVAILTLAAWWAGNQIANQYSGLKNLRRGDVGLQKELDVPMECSVEEQYLAAYWMSKELHADNYEQRALQWKAVEVHFPKETATDVNITELYHLRAKCRLGEIYLESGNLEKAAKVYEDLAKQDEMSLEFRTTGLAGKAITYYRRPAESFEGKAQEQQSLIRLCLDDEVGGTGGVRENFELLNDFLKEKVAILLEEFKSYGNYKYPLPPRRSDFAGKKRYWLSKS